MNRANPAQHAQRMGIIVEIRRLAEAAGGAPPGQQRFERITGLPRTSWHGRFWSRWSDALREAGFAANEKRPRLDDEIMLAQFAEAARRLKRIPSNSDLTIERRNGSDMPWPHTFAKHFGGKRGLLDRLRAWAAARPDAADIAAMIPEFQPPRPLRRSRTNGGVYLLRAGECFKIGCSKAIIKRVRRLQNILPESELVHRIETDDPRGVEAYWHRRFAAKRVKGEWFELTPEDVAAFRRWRMQ